MSTKDLPSDDYAVAGTQKTISDSNGQPIDRRSILAKLDSGEMRAVHNFTGDKMAQWRMVAKATGPDCRKFEDMPDGGIQLVYYYCHRVEMISQRDGEMIEPIRCVLIDKDGANYGFVSDFIARELDNIIEMWGPGPWITTPLHIRVVRAKSRKGMTFYSIQPA